MRHVAGLTGLALALMGLLACPGDDGNGETGGMASTGPSGSTTMASTGPGGSTGGTTMASTGVADSGSSSGPGESSSSGGGPLCDPVVVGEWNACLDDMGNIDNLLCNWMGDPDSNGFLTCLSSAEIKGGNICTIRDCVDTCDCFPQPETGTAVVVCAPILKGGDNACGLDCSEGQTCPDDMECGGGLCFWPPAG